MCFTKNKDGCVRPIYYFPLPKLVVNLTVDAFYDEMVLLQAISFTWFYFSHATFYICTNDEMQIIIDLTYNLIQTNLLRREQAFILCIKIRHRCMSWSGSDADLMLIAYILMLFSDHYLNWAFDRSDL